MNEEVFNLQLRQFLKKFGITAQREIEHHVRNALENGAIRGNERLDVTARLTLAGLPPEIVVEGRIALE
ncbi:MAG: DUF6494 family protein [Longimicrobiales bacterium]